MKEGAAYPRGRTGDCPGPRKGTAFRRNITQGDWTPPPLKGKQSDTEALCQPPPPPTKGALGTALPACCSPQADEVMQEHQELRRQMKAKDEKLAETRQSTQATLQSLFSAGFDLHRTLFHTLSSLHSHRLPWARSTPNDPIKGFQVPRPPVLPFSAAWAAGCCPQHKRRAPRARSCCRGVGCGCAAHVPWVSGR